MLAPSPLRSIDPNKNCGKFTHETRCPQPRLGRTRGLRQCVSDAPGDGLDPGEGLFLISVAVWVFAIVLNDAGMGVPSPAPRRGSAEITVGTAFDVGPEIRNGGRIHGRW